MKNMWRVLKKKICGEKKIVKTLFKSFKKKSRRLANFREPDQVIYEG